MNFKSTIKTYHILSSENVNSELKFKPSQHPHSPPHFAPEFSPSLLPPKISSAALPALYTAFSRVLFQPRAPLQLPRPEYYFPDIDYQMFSPTDPNTQGYVCMLSYLDTVQYTFNLQQNMGVTNKDKYKDMLINS